VLTDPVVEHVLELRVQRDVAVVVELADRDPKPVGGADLDNGVDVRASSSLLRMPVRASNSTISRASGSGSARLVRMSFVAAASSRNRGRGLSMIGRSPMNMSGRWGGLG